MNDRDLDNLQSDNKRGFAGEVATEPCSNVRLMLSDYYYYWQSAVFNNLCNSNDRSVHIRV